MVGDGLLGCLIVLVNTRTSAFHHYKTGLFLACHFHYAIEVDIFARSGAPTAIEPKNVYIAVVRHQLFHLVEDKLLIIFPTLGILFDFVVMAAVRCGFLGPPIVVAVPVGLREIGARHQTFIAERIEHIAQCILTRIALKTAVGDIEIGGLGVPKAEAVVVLGGENHIFHTCIFGYTCPLLGIELHGIELVD